MVTTNNFTHRIFSKLGMGEFKAVPWPELEIEGGLKPFQGVKSNVLCGFFAELKDCTLN